ncbi:hypothetical protein NQ318_010623 [Aromia moschata]|uniref:Uncharacterized protein n=1 Tax=Aromia moschata TaxID=1265417 RepID=A0AAV8XLI8_9CUCU|nr:hypothetical protein NQ318_010623 [Aromia moschata]
MDIKKKQHNLLASQDRIEEDLRFIQIIWELIISKHDLLKSIDGEIYEALLEADTTKMIY